MDYYRLEDGTGLQTGRTEWEAVPGAVAQPPRPQREQKGLERTGGEGAIRESPTTGQQVERNGQVAQGTY